MVTKSQKKTQNKRRKAKKRQQEKQLRQTSPAKRLASRLVKQKPRAWPDEPAEDVAVFDDGVISDLSPEGQDHARLIREALQAVCSRSAGSVLESLSVIPRRSPFAQWRIFLRGLVDWIGNDLAAAEETWSRLDNQRRPARIAMSLILAHRDDLPEMEQGRAEAAPGSEWFGELDTELVYHAKLVRKHQIDRPAIRAAKGITQITEVVEGVLVNPFHINWMRDFTAEHRSLEPELVQALHEATNLRAYCSSFADMFALSIKFLRGPRHDRKNRLLAYFYELQFADSNSADDLLKKYLEQDLPNNTELAPRLRDALASQIHLTLATDALIPEAPAGLDIFSMFSNGPDIDLAADHFAAAVKAYPENRNAWQAYQTLFSDLLDDDQLKKAQREVVLADLADLHQRWSQALPDDIEPRLALVDYLLEHERSEEAKEHVDWLAGTRSENPLVDAMNWKWNLLEAMRLCRRKAWLQSAPEHLDQAAENWPKWLADDWMPFLRAAVNLRGGDRSAFDSLEPADDAGSRLTVDCMKLGAAQLMRVPAADLKPLRKPIDDALANLKRLSTDDLLRFASFHWDIRRTGLRCPALTKTGTKFLAHLLKRFNAKPRLANDRLGGPLIRAALLTMARDRMFNDTSCVSMPRWANWESDPHPAVAAAAAAAACQCRYSWGIGGYDCLSDPLRKAARKEDPFYSHFYNQLADELDEKLATQGGGRFSSIFGDLTEATRTSECDCDDCRAARGEIV